MSYIPINDIRILWSQTFENSWESFRKTINRFYYQSDNESQSRLDRIDRIAKYYEYAEEPFPETYQELHQILNQTYST